MKQKAVFAFFYQSKDQITLHYPGLEIRLDQKRVLKNNQDVQLSRYEYGVLCFLATHPGCVLTKEQI